MGARTPAARTQVVLIGPFPPPVHGMAIINAAMRDELRAAGLRPTVLDVSAGTLKRTPSARLTRLPRIARALLALLRGTSGSASPLYLSVSAGPGQLYETAFALCARLRRHPIYLHHHSFAYLDRPSVLAWLLFRLAGRRAVHIVLSTCMAERLARQYGINRVVAISNSAFLPPPRHAGSPDQERVRVIGFMSNLSVEKGVLEFLDLLAHARSQGSSLTALVAGPFERGTVEGEVKARIDAISQVRYLGPVYGEAKETFFRDIDVFVFPSLHREAEPVVIHEAMSRGIPVLARDRGCISEIVSSRSGLVVDAAMPFVPAAFDKIKQWVQSPQSYREASRAALEEFARTQTRSLGQLHRLLADISGLDGASNGENHS